MCTHFEASPVQELAADVEPFKDEDEVAADFARLVPLADDGESLDAAVLGLVVG